MKKIFAWILLVTLVLGTFAGCGCQKQPDPTEPSTTAPVEEAAAGIEDVIEYLKAIYKDEGAKTPVDYERFGIVRIAGIPFEVVWTVDVSEDLIKIVVNDDGTVTIDVNEKCDKDTPYVLTATVTDENGKSVSYSWNYTLPAAVDMVSIVKEAYALKSGESLPYESTLTGKIIAIGTPYDAEYKNITVTIEIEGAEDMPIVCYRLKGEGADKLAIGDIITVTGTLTNYNGTIEFAAGCTLDAVTPGERVEAPDDPKQIVDEAYELGANKSLPYEATLTGKITKITTPYSSQYGNITVVMVVEGRENKPITAYRLKGTGVDDLDVGDTITVRGYITNYVGDAGYSTIEFTAGCQLVSYKNTGTEFVMPSTAAEIVKLAYSLAKGDSLPEEATLTGVISKVNTPYDSGYKNVTVTIIVDGMTDYPIMCYRLKGDGADKIGKGDTITVTGILTNYNGTIEFTSGCVLNSWKDTGTDAAEDNTTVETTLTAQLVEEPKAGTAYKLYVEQNKLKKVLYFTGAMDGYYLATSEDPAKAVDVYLEEVTGGVRVYFTKDNAKTYIDLVKDGDYINLKLVATPTTTYTYNTDLDTVVATVGDTQYYIGTYSSYDTLSASKTSYVTGTSASSIGVSNFVSHFGTLVEKEVEKDDKEEATSFWKTEPVTAPVAGTAYKLGLQQKKISGEPWIYFNGETANSYYLGTTQKPTEAVDVKLVAVTGGYNISFTDSTGATKYINLVQSGSYVNAVIGDTATTVFTHDATLNCFKSDVGGTAYYIGTYGTFETLSASKIDYITGENAGDLDTYSFPVRLLTVQEVTIATAEDGAAQLKKDYPNGYKDDMSLPTSVKVGDYEFTVTWKVETANAAAAKIEGGKLVTAQQDAAVDYKLVATVTGTDGKSATTDWSYTVAAKPVTLADGTYVLWVKESGIAMGAVAENENYDYLDGVNVTLSGSTLSGYKNAHRYTVQNSGDGTFKLIDAYGRYVYMAGTFNSFNVATEVPENGNANWVAEPASSGSFYIRNAANEKTIAYDSSYGSFGAYSDKKSELTLTAAPKVAITAKTAVDALKAEYPNGFRSDATLPATYTVKDVEEVTFNVAWAVTNETGYDTAAEIVEGKLVLTPLDKDVTYTLKATVSKDSDTATTTWDGTISTVFYVAEKVTALETGKAYKLGLTQKGIAGQPELFAISTLTDKYFMNTSEACNEGADVYLEAVEGVEGGYRMYFMVDTTKTYIRVNLENGSGKLELTTTQPTEYYTYSTELDTLIYTDGDNTSYYLGTYSNYATFGASKTSYITDSNLDVSQFPARFYTVKEVSGDATAEEGLAELKKQYGDKIAAETELTDTVKVRATTFQVTWEIVSGDSAAAINSENKLILTAQNEDVTYELKATVTKASDSSTATYTWSDTVEGLPSVYADLMTEAPADGDVIVIYSTSAGEVMTATANGNKLTGVAAAVAENKLPLADAMAQLTVSIDGDGYYTFTTADGKYLTSGATGNSLTLADAASDYSLWTVVESTETDGVWYIKNANAVSNNKVQSLEYYNGFTTYGHKDQAAYQMQLFEVPQDPALMTEAPVNGDVIVIYSTSAGEAMTATANGNKLTGVAATVTENKLPLTDTMAQLNVIIDNDGYYTFITADGEYLTSGATGNSLTLEATASDYSLWTLVESTETDGIWFIKNVNAKFNNNVQAVEYHYGFTTYGEATTEKYQMQLFKVSSGAGTPSTPPAPTVPTAAEAAAALKASITALTNGRDLATTYTYQNTVFDVVWSVEPVTDAAKIVAHKLVLTAQAEDVAYTLKATVSLGNDSAEATWADTVTGTATPAPSIITIAEALAAADGTADLRVKGVVTLVDSSNIYLQDDTGAICVRMATAPTDITLGETIIGTGERATYYGLPQLGSATYEKSSGMTLTAVSKTLDTLSVADVCSYVQIQDLTVTSVGTSVDLKDANNNTIQLYKAVKPEGLAVGDVVTVKAAVGIYNNAPQLRNTLATEITVTSTGSGGNDETLDTPEEIVNAAYALASGVTLDGTYTLSGVITSVDDAYSTQYQNVTVTIVVDNMTDKPIKCFHMKGTGADTIAVGDHITVTGSLTNYNDTIEFAANCTLDSVMTPKMIVDALYMLQPGESLESKYTLTGVITAAEEYNTQYSNVTVTMQVGDMTDKLVKCFRMKGTGADQIAVGDTIAVYGTLKNYSGTYEFDSGCTLVSYAKKPAANVIQKTYDFSTYAAGVQYAEETHALDDMVSMHIVKCHLNGEVRIYSSTTNNGIVTFTCTKVISSVTMNLGNKADTLNVYGSTDGTNWELIQGVTTTSAYQNHTVDVDETKGYTYLKLDVAGTQQVRMKSISFDFVS